MPCSPWLLFILLAAETDNLISKLPTKTHQLQAITPLQERHFAAPLRHAEKLQLY